MSEPRTVHVVVGRGRIMAVHATRDEAELDARMRNSRPPTIRQIGPPFDYGVESWRVLAAEAASPAALDVPDMNVLCAILDDLPPRIADTLGIDGEAVAAWIVGHWTEYARLTAEQEERGGE